MIRNILFILFIFPLIGISQTGPGGVGTIDGLSSLKIWLRADDLDADNDFTDNPANGTLVSTWADYSGNANDYTNTLTNRPTYNTAGTFNAINFDASVPTPQYLNGTSTGAYTDASAFFVSNQVNDGASNSLFDDATNYGLKVEQWSNTGMVGYTRYGVADYSSTLSTPFGINSIISYHKTGASSNFDIRVNANTATLGVGSSAAGIPYDAIGGNHVGADEVSGDFYEVILYNSRVNSAQVIIIENYLSAKHGNISIPNDIYDEDNSGNGDYDYDVAGIGRVDASNLHNDAQGTGIVRILNPTGLGDNEFLIWGHDNGVQQATNTTDIPAGVQARFDRVWRVSERNTANTSNVNVGNIDMRWDLSGLGTITVTDLRLLIDTDNDGLFSDETPISGATSLGGNIYEFANVPGGASGISNNRRFTLGTINTSQTPLPIELIRFNAKAIDNQFISINWETVLELNNDYFTVERATFPKPVYRPGRFQTLEKLVWETVTTIQGAGNSSTLTNYNTVDSNPFTGVSYYRLRQTDFDGKFTYSNIVAVEFDPTVYISNENGPMLLLFPNPTTSDNINVKLQGFDLEKEVLVAVLDQTGREYYSKVVITDSKGSVTTAIDPYSKLAAGLYLVIGSSGNSIDSDFLIITQ